MLAMHPRNPAALRSTARILFGQDWYDGLCAVLNVAPATLEDWLDGRAAIPMESWRALDRCLHTVGGLQKAQAQLRAALDRPSGTAPR